MMEFQIKLLNIFLESIRKHLTDLGVLSVWLNDGSVTRYVLSKDWIRSSDKTIRYDAFLAYRYTALSVYYIRDLPEETTWEIGSKVARKRKKHLYGRADIEISQIDRIAHENSLELKAKLNNRPKRHTLITGYPTDKPSQKKVALKLAAEATFRPLN